MAPEIDVARARAALQEVEATAVSLDMFSTEHQGDDKLPSVGQRRRRLRAGEPDPVSTISLVLNDDGVLLWRESAPAGEVGVRRLRRRREPLVDGDLVELYQYEKLEPNEIGAFLVKLDGKLTPSPGLWRLTQGPAPGQIARGAAVGPGEIEGKQRRLLLVHGTFSESASLLHGIGAAPNGPDFVKRVFAHYGNEVYAFDHPTLSVSPVLNGFDLHRLFRAADGPLDVVAHSRGGLVTRWFLEGFGAGTNGGPHRAVLVGSPLGGTSLASPARLRDALSVLTNLGTVLRAAGSVAVVYLPLLAAPLALLKIATSVVSVAAKTPLIDAAVAMIPGLAGQSRIDGNAELDRLSALGTANRPEYFVVQANFETEDPGWKFWRWFRGKTLGNVGADKIFPGANDLVVDTASMSQIGPPGSVSNLPVCDFETSATVHHTNYFEQADTLGFVLESFDVP